MSAEVIMGFDYGLRRIGVAVGNRISASARGIAVIANRNRPDWEALAGLIAEWRPQTLIVGLPLGMDGSRSKMAVAAQDFATELHRRFQLPVDTVDERLSSREAKQRLAERRAGGRMARRVRKGDTDATAAAVILEDWLNEQ